MPNVTEILTRGYHMDVFGHVNNARYLEFLEEGRWALLEAHLDLAKWAAQGLVFMVVNINVNYRKAVGPGERLEVTTGLQKLGNRSGVLDQEIRFKDSQEIAADAVVTFVIAGPDGSAVSIEGKVQEDLLKLDSG
jgi:thioesterase-3